MARRTPIISPKIRKFIFLWWRHAYSYARFVLSYVVAQKNTLKCIFVCAKRIDNRLRACRTQKSSHQIVLNGIFCEFTDIWENRYFWKWNKWKVGRQIHEKLGAKLFFMTMFMNLLIPHKTTFQRNKINKRGPEY